MSDIEFFGLPLPLVFALMTIINILWLWQFFEPYIQEMRAKVK